MPTRPIRRRRLLAGAALAACLPRMSLAAGYPSRPVVLVVPYPPGGSSDIVGRLIAERLAERLGQAVVVENKAGAGTTLGAAAVAHAPADGYTLLFASNSSLTIAPALRPKLPYDPLRSFESIGGIGSSPLVLLAHPSLPADSLQQLVTLARSQPGKLNYASFGTGTISHFAGEMLKSMAGLDIVHVPYKGSAPALQDLIGGQVQLAFDLVVAARQQIEAGRVKAIAVTSRRRSPSLREVPTFAESGFPDYEMVAWAALLAPQGLPDEARRALVPALAEVLAEPGVESALAKAGVDLAYEPPQAYEPRVKREAAWIRRQVQQAGITID